MLNDSYKRNHEIIQKWMLRILNLSAYVNFSEFDEKNT